MKKAFGCVVATSLWLGILAFPVIIIGNLRLAREVMIPLIFAGEIGAALVFILILRSRLFSRFSEWVERD